MYFVLIKVYDKVVNEIKSYNLVIVLGYLEFGKLVII